MQDVADRVGVSKALVSLVFRKAPGPSSETRARVFAAAEELGYRVNRTAALMSARRTQLLGVTAEVRNTFHAELVEYIVSAADRAGYEVALGAITPTHSESRVIETLLDFRCEGIILLGPVASLSELSRLSERVPVVSVGRRLSIPTLDVVRAADSRGIAAVADHLVELGHRRIVYVAGGSGSIRADRRDGYLRAMKRHGLSHNVSVIDGDFTEGSGIAAAEALLASGELPTAVVAANDRMAIGVLDTLRRAGVDVPGEVSVTGFDNSPLARLSHVDLTTVSQEPLEQADRAVAAVTERLDAHRTESVISVLTPQLVVRKTTAKARDAVTATA
ncbi:LacI family transcriptional regulator [Mycolicibacterium sp. 018/SC-01/001]|uniref:LacI family DNA-binding transcriptional regulator n=1 Tax=Mycolicibacterium sp. 018/SC-01/001 TaxID=2592069 RepID=UPI00117EDEF4|nr:LacI family DNA-binding transcriptional regulator [Mycolicibacterium sp. 018/SC-01/001]TRW88073.1 LacI family transcriptional regulator [Mycolicibacterium sp. 018/SC-01/001]